MRILNSNSEIPVNQFSGFKYFPVFILQVTKCKLSESLDKVRRLLSVKVCPPHAGGLAPTFPSARPAEAIRTGRHGVFRKHMCDYEFITANCQLSIVYFQLSTFNSLTVN